VPLLKRGTNHFFLRHLAASVISALKNYTREFWAELLFSNFSQPFIVSFAGSTNRKPGFGEDGLSARQSRGYLAFRPSGMGSFMYVPSRRSSSYIVNVDHHDEQAPSLICPFFCFYQVNSRL
jgi:hypothetical protein